MSTSVDSEKEKEKDPVSRRVFLRNSMAAMTGVLVSGHLVGNADSASLPVGQTAAEGASVIQADEVRASHSSGLKLTSTNTGPKAHMDFRTGGRGWRYIRMRISQDGRVGIGTTTPGVTAIDEMYPLLDVAGYASFNGLRIGQDGVNDILSENQDGLTLTAKGDDDPDNKVWYGGIKFRTGNSKGIRMRITPDGRVGIGTEKPAQDIRLTVAGHQLVQDPRGYGTQDDPWDEAILYLGDEHHSIKAERGLGLRFGSWGSPDAMALQQGTGNVGIGTTTPSERLHIEHGNVKVVDGTVDLSHQWGDWIFLRQGRDGVEGTSGFHIHKPEVDLNQPDRPDNRLEIGYRGEDGNDRWGQFVLHGPTGRVGIGTTSPQTQLHVVGQITANDILLNNADCAEEFSVAETEPVEPGTVMVIDHGTALRQCRAAYDTKVVGVVSGAGDYKPALLLDRQTDQANRLPIALMGKVFCKVDADKAPVEVGDLLTTSATCGHAMKATDPRQAFGAIIGKALGALESGTGLIPILVTLQ